MKKGNVMAQEYICLSCGKVFSDSDLVMCQALNNFISLTGLTATDVMTIRTRAMLAANKMQARIDTAMNENLRYCDWCGVSEIAAVQDQGPSADIISMTVIDDGDLVCENCMKEMTYEPRKI